MTRALLCTALCALGCSSSDPADGDAAIDEAARDRDGAMEQGPARDGGSTFVPPEGEPCDEAGLLEEVPCGRCGTSRRFCTSEKLWEYGPCESEGGACTPGESESRPCGACGTAMAVCTASCEWDLLGECTGEGVCMPGSLIRSSEGCERGERDLRCSDACELEPIGECAVDECERPGATEDVPCGDCGTRVRFCTSEGEWEYGLCESEGECTPGTSRESSCGNCGTSRQRCTDRCAWDASGGCEDEGECAPGSMRSTSEGCRDGQAREERCSDACEYEEAGACRMSDARLGESCAVSACAPGLACISDTGVAICRRPCSDDNPCPSSSTACTSDGHCTDRCTLFTDAGCPDGAKCDLIRRGVLSPLPLPGTGSDDIVICSAVGRGRTGAPCEWNSECARAHVCRIPEEGPGTCTALCDEDHPCPRGLECDALDTGGLPSGFPISGGVGYCE